MKKLLILIILIPIIVVLISNSFKEDQKNKIVVSEVTHSVFYAPWYVALENNYFEDLNIEVVLTSGANNVISSVLSNDADIGLCGLEAVLYVQDNTEKIKYFASLTKRDGQFLVLKNNIKFDNISDLENKTILSGRAGGMPLLSFKQVIKNQDIKNVSIDSSVDFANLSAAFIAGNQDGVNLFEPNATNLVKNGYGYIATMIGTYSNVVPYTVFSSKESFIKEHPNEIKIFYEGINKGLQYVKTHSSEEIANTIKNQFKDIEFKDLIVMIENYKKNDSWFDSASLNEEAYLNLENMLLENKMINKKYDFNDITYDIIKAK